MKAEGVDPRRVARSALRAYFRIAKLWRLTLREERTLLGGPNLWTFLCWKMTHIGAPAADVMKRISYVLGIFKALEILLPVPASADDWMQKPNSNPRFGGRRPLDLALDEGTSGLRWVRAYLDSQHTGAP